MRYLIDPAVERLDRGRALLGGDPTRLMRLSAAGAAVVDRWRASGAHPAAVSVAEAALLDRMVEAGMAVPDVNWPESDWPDVDLDDLVVVVPVKDRPVELDLCLERLRDSGALRIVVVDDGSADAAAHRIVAERYGAELVRRDRSGGPAVARMSGWRSLEPKPTYVAFVDSDVVVMGAWLEPLVELLGDERVGLAAPRVMHPMEPGALNRYERANSPLDLGSTPALIRAGTRVSYVPAAALVVRSSAFDEVDGFDERLDVGEDVDLVWRLNDAGWRCWYEPTSMVAHRGRDRLGALLRRRIDYGRSAAVLDERHPGRLPPLRGSRWSAAVAGMLVAGHPLLASALVAGNVVAMERKLGDLPERRRIASRLVVRGHVGFLRQLVRSTIRPWWPLALLALTSRRLRPAVALAVAVDLIERSPLGVADDVAYATGVWLGCIERHRPGPLNPFRANCQN